MTIKYIIEWKFPTSQYWRVWYKNDRQTNNDFEPEYFNSEEFALNFLNSKALLYTKYDFRLVKLEVVEQREIIGKIELTKPKFVLKYGVEE